MRENFSNLLFRKSCINALNTKNKMKTFIPIRLYILAISYIMKKHSYFKCSPYRKEKEDIVKKA